MSEQSAKVLLASVILARSSSYVLQKIVLTDIDVFNLMGIRFLLAFFIMLIIFNKRLLSADKPSVCSGLIAGAVYFVVMSLEVFSLKTCDSSTTAFLENTAIVMVPLFEAVLLKKMPLPKTAIGFIMAISGVALMTLKGSSLYFSAGHILAVGAAVTYAAAIIITDRISKKSNPLVIGIVQLGIMGILSSVSSFVFESPRLPSEPVEWLAIVLLALVCSCFGFTLQPVAQKYTSSETAGLYCAFGPLGAGILGWICLGETLSRLSLIGAILIILSIMLIQGYSKRLS